MGWKRLTAWRAAAAAAWIAAATASPASAKDDRGAAPALPPSLAAAFERAWLDAHRRVAPLNRKHVRKLQDRRRALRERSNRPSRRDRPLGR